MERFLIKSVGETTQLCYSVEPAPKKRKVVEDAEISEGIENWNSSDSTSSEGVSSESSKRLFRMKWAEAFSWLIQIDAKAFCKACNKSLQNHLGHLKRHDKNVMHKKNLKAAKGQIKITSFSDTKEKHFQKQVKSAELTLVMFCLIHHLPFILMDNLPNLLKECSPDSEIAKSIRCGRTKAVQLTEFLGKKGRENVARHLRKSKFSLVVDESTEVINTKVLVLVARYFDVHMQSIKERFLALLPLQKADANSIYNAINKFLCDFNIPVQNMIGLATDGASVMAGELGGLQAKFKNNNQNLFYVKCICHSLHLCASYACKKLPVSTERLCRDVYSFFAHSSKKIIEFKEFVV